MRSYVKTTLVRPTIVVAALAATMLASCKEQWETEDYQAGYEAGYEDARYEICRAWEVGLPSGLYDRYKPRACR